MTSRTHLDASTVPMRTQGEGQPGKAQGPELFVLDSVDGLSSIEELSMMLAMSENEVMQIVARLHELQLVRWESPPVEHDPADEVHASEDKSASASELPPDRHASAFENDPTEESGVHTFRFVTAPAVQADASDKKRQQQPTVEQRAVPPKIVRPSAPPPLPSETQEPPPTRRDVIKTPRQHLDTSWWRSTGRTEEPDEKLTSREISNSGLRFAPPAPEKVSNPTMALSPAADKLTAQHDVVTDRVEPITASIETQPEDDNDAAANVEQKRIKSGRRSADERQAKLDAESVVDELAHTRGSGAPLLPDIEFEDDWDEETTPIDSERPWKDEPVLPAIAAERTRWSKAEAQEISFYMRLIEHGTYYDIFGVEQGATLQEIRVAADRIAKRLDFDALRTRGATEGRAILLKVQNGLQRAFDVLENPESRAQYDAALDALAAFKLS